MMFAPGREEFFSVLNVIGKILVVLGFLFLIPAAIAYYFKELNPLYDFLISFCIVEFCGFFLMIVFPFKRNLDLSLAFLLVAVLWLLIPFFGAIPLFLSEHFNSFLDAFFESMSGFATAGLSLLNDIDHAPYSVNFWRHFIMFLGGQGIILVVLSFLGASSSIGMDLYMGEARDEKIMPNIMATARFIWVVSIFYFVLGTAALFVCLKINGFKTPIALLHSACLFMAAFDTGGFTPQSMNIYYYHSIALEMVIIFLMMLGMVNFNLHYFVWMIRKRELVRNIEMKTFFVTFTVLLIGMVMPLMASNINGNVVEFFRKVVFQLVSAHSGCGFANIRVSEFVSWPEMSQLFMIIAMALGGSVGSTTGGIKLMRVALLFKSIGWEIRKTLVPDKVWVFQKYHHLHTKVLEEPKVRIIFVITFLYCMSYFLGALVGMLYGNSFFDSLFESTSAAANVGLSVGITSPSMPTGLKITYIIQMWTGRLEFLAIIVGIGLIGKSLLRVNRKNTQHNEAQAV